MIQQRSDWTSKASIVILFLYWILTTSALSYNTLCSTLSNIKQFLRSCSLAQPPFNHRPLSAHMRNTIRMVFRWLADDVDPLFDVSLVLASPASIQCRATIGPPAKRHSNGVFAGRPIVARSYMFYK